MSNAISICRLGVLATAACLSASAAAQRVPSLPPAAMPPLAPAVVDDALAIGGNDIDARKVRTRMTVAVHVNGTGPYRFVVDSGADTSVIGTRIAAALALPPGRSAILNGMTGTSRVDRVLVDELGVGTSKVTHLQLPVIPERFLGGDGMIGIDALVEQRLMLDFEKRLIKVEDASRPAPRYDGEIVVTARLRRGQLIITQARTNGRPVEVVIDTGSEITIGNLALRDQIVRRTRKPLATVTATGVTGAKMELQLTRIAEMRLGPVVLRDVPVAFADVPPFTVFGLNAKPALLLGTDLMDAFRRVSLDFRARKVRFQLRRCSTDGIAISTSPSASLTRVSTSAMDACRR